MKNCFKIAASNSTSELRLLYSKDALKLGTVNTTIAFGVPQHTTYLQKTTLTTENSDC